MRRLWFYFLKNVAFCSRVFSTNLYMRILLAAHKSVGVKFLGQPEYIQLDAYLDASGGLTISEGVVISTKAIILSHDWSWLKRISNKSPIYKNKGAFSPVYIGKNSFIGAGAIVLSGTKIGCNCIIGAGAVVKGDITDYSIVIGNPCQIIGTTNNDIHYITPRRSIIEFNKIAI